MALVHAFDIEYSLGDYPRCLDLLSLLIPQSSYCKVYFLDAGFVRALLSSQSRLIGSRRKDARRQETMNSKYIASRLPAAIII